MADAPLLDVVRKRMQDDSQSEQAERSTAQGMTGSPESARADMWHSDLNAMAQDQHDLAKREADRGRKGKM